MPQAVCDYAIAFLLTIALETAVAWLLGYRQRLELACVVAVNVFSHPLLHLIVWTAALWHSAPLSLPTILLLEAGVVVVEWRLMCFALPNRSRSGLFFLSLAMNSVSYLTGYFLLPWNG